MLHRLKYPLLFLALCSAFAWTTLPDDPDWGFFGHRRINRLAVFTLDEEMMPFFRAHVEWLTEHAVDPDKRRYASKHEAVRHYIDIDHWGERGSDFPHLPRRWTDALLWKAELIVVGAARDSQIWHVDTITHPSPDRLFYPDSRVLLRDKRGGSVELQLGAYRDFWFNNVLPQYYEDAIIIKPDSLRAVGFPVADGINSIVVRENFSGYGILPYHLESMHRRITKAFVDENPDQILRLCAEMGHYVGDAHVPLHTTENYNGQLSGQTGIHAFWESRLPELFADEEYDFFVGKAEYIDNPREYYWEMVLKSHSLVDSVFRTEQRLRDTYPKDQQLCFEERLGRTVSTQCAEFSAAWDREMQGMVEERFRAAIHSVGSVWYSCWVDAGQPDLRRLVPRPTLFAKSDTLDRAVQAGVIKGRVHE